jgi:polyisoprenoid-binding protein YceI
MSTTSFTIDHDHTAVGFGVRHMLVSSIRGRFKKYRTELSLDTDDLTASHISWTVEVASVDTAVPARDEHLRSKDFFDVERYPTLRFVSQKIERLYPAHFRVTGELTIKDTTLPVSLDVEFGGIVNDRVVGGTRIGFTAKGSIDRREFGLTWDEVLETGGLVVGDRIQLVIEGEAVSQASDRRHSRANEPATEMEGTT